MGTASVQSDCRALAPGGRTLYPLPDSVCEYAPKHVFDQRRVESGQWVFWHDRVELVLAGRYHEVKPLHVELSPTYLCNFACPWCSCRTAREDWSDEDVFNHPHATDSTVMNGARINRVVDHLAEHEIGIQWVGGEPTMNPLLYPAVRRAHELGLQQCLFTNGSLLDEKRISILLDAALVFIRVSLDAVSPGVHEAHHGYGPERHYRERVLQGLRTLIRLRRDIQCPTMIGVSVVVDERNLGDMGPIAEFLCGCCSEYGYGAVNYIIVRPTYQFYSAQVQLNQNTGGRLAELVAAGAQIRGMLNSAGIKVVAPGESFAAPETPADPSSEACLSCGWFGEVTPNGDLVLCSDRYGHPDYFVGNIGSESLDDIWGGKKRQQVLQRAETERCFRSYCPRNGRGFHLNRLFHQIERFRAGHRMHEVRRWIQDLREVLPPPEHPFFL